MGKPSVLSIGIGMGVLMLGGSGVAIPTLWSQADRARQDRDELRVSWQEQRAARVANEDALKASEAHVEALQDQLAAAQESLTAAEETKRVLTNQLAETQVRNRELMAASGTLALRDKETAALVQQLEQARSDNASLLAQRDAATETANSERKPEPEADDAATDDLVPVPANMAFLRKPAADKPATTSQSTAKPAPAEPVRFDDSGWKSAPLRVPGTPVVLP